MDQFEDQFSAESREPLGLPFDEEANFDFRGSRRVAGSATGRLPFGELAARHRCTVDAVSPGLGANVKD